LHQRYVARLRSVEAEKAAKEAAAAPPPMARAPETAKVQPAAPAPQVVQPQSQPQQQTPPPSSDVAKTADPARLEASSKFEPLKPEAPKLETRPEPVTFVAPSVAPLPPKPPEGLRDQAGQAQKPNGSNFDLSTPKIVPKLN